MLFSTARSQRHRALIIKTWRRTASGRSGPQLAESTVTTANTGETIAVVDSKCTYESTAFSQQSDKNLSVLSESTWSPLGVHSIGDPTYQKPLGSGEVPENT
jgi:hypothetical protein